MSRMLQAALKYAAIGWYVFPLTPHGRRKAPHPMLGPKGGHHLATTDPKQIEAWWTEDPNAGIGVHMRRSGVLAVDSDPRDGGDKTLAALQAEHGRLDTPCIQDTGGGGEHYIFAAPPGLASVPGSLGPGVQVKWNGYICVAPTLHESGRIYRWRPGMSPVANHWALDAPPAWVLTRQQASRGGAKPDSDDPFADLGAQPIELDADELRAKLMSIPTDDKYEPWLQVGQALHHQFGGAPEGLDLWLEWSRRSVHFDADECARKWDSFQRSGEGGALTARLILKRAKEHEPKPEAPEAAREDSPGDVMNGAYFAARYRGRFLYSRATKEWFQWDGTRWRLCQLGEEREAAKDAASDRLREMKEVLSKAEKKAAAHPRNAVVKAAAKDARRHYAAAAATYGSIRKLEAMLESASSLPGMSVASPAAFDTDPWLLVVRNGVLDLRTGRLVPADPSMRISKQADAAFDPDAKCPMFLRFLDDTFGGDAEMIRYMQRALGYGLTGLVTEEVLFFFYGLGANGKSVLINIVSAILGDYAVVVGSEILRRQQGGGSSVVERLTVRLVGARMALVNETRQGDRWDDQKAKELTSTEKFSARRLYAEAFDVRPTHKLWVRGNHKPAISDDSSGLWRRLHLIGFENTIPEERRVRDLAERILEAERDGILAWMVRGCLEWQRVGLKRPAAVKEGTEAYERENDLLGLWLSECCEVGDPTFEAPMTAAYAEYRRWAVDGGLKPISHIALSRELRERGFRERRTSKARFYVGFRLKPDDDTFA